MRLFLVPLTLLLALCVAPARAEEWYLPRPTHNLAGGSFEAGARLQFGFDRSGLAFDRTASSIMALRYAPTGRVEFYVEGPYTYIEQERTVFPSLLHSTDQQGWGDVYGQVSFDVASGGDWKVSFSTDAVFPTGKNPYEHNRILGSGFYRFAPGLTYVKILDPAALFFYIGHQWTVPEEYRGFGKIEPGEDFRFRTGMSLSLNPRLQASAFVAGNIIGHTRQRSVEIAGTDADLFRFGGGINWSITDRVRLDWSAVFGATDATQDAVLSLGLTYKIK